MPTLKNPRHEAFAVAVAGGQSPTQAYAKVYGKDPSKRHVSANAVRVGSYERVAARIKELQEASANEAVLDLADVLRQLKKLIYFDARKFFKENGEPKSIHELGDDEAAALAGLEVLEEFEGTGRDRVFVGYTKKYRLADRGAAIDKALRSLGAYVDKVEHTGKGGAPLVTWAEIVAEVSKARNAPKS